VQVVEDLVDQVVINAQVFQDLGKVLLDLLVTAILRLVMLVSMAWDALDQLLEKL